MKLKAGEPVEAPNRAGVEAAPKVDVVAPNKGVDEAFDNEADAAPKAGVLACPKLKLGVCKEENKRERMV